MRLTHFITGLAVAGTVAGCGASADTTSPVTANDSEITVDPDTGFAAEEWGVGGSWYNYDSSTRVVTPKDEVYAIVEADREIYFEITSYYDDRGESGRFSLTTGGEPIMLEGNVKEAPTCVAFEPLREVTCGEEAVVYFSTMRRPLPDGGFAVRNPGFWVIPAEGRELYVIDAPSVAEVDPSWQDDAEPVISVATTPSASRIADVEGVHIQIDGDLELTAWELVDNAFEVRCAPADWENETPLAEATAKTVDFPGEPGLYTVKLCDGLVEPVQPNLGLWPDNGEYDLYIEIAEGTEGAADATLILYPGVLHWRWSTTDSLDAVTDTAIWEGYES
jgi:hypothetical protein